MYTLSTLNSLIWIVEYIWKLPLFCTHACPKQDFVFIPRKVWVNFPDEFYLWQWQYLAYSILHAVAISTGHTSMGSLTTHTPVPHCTSVFCFICRTKQWVHNPKATERTEKVGVENRIGTCYHWTFPPNASHTMEWQEILPFPPRQPLVDGKHCIIPECGVHPCATCMQKILQWNCSH